MRFLLIPLFLSSVTAQFITILPPLPTDSPPSIRSSYEAPINANVSFILNPTLPIVGQTFLGQCQPVFSVEPEHYWIGFYKDDLLLAEYKIINYKHFINMSEIFNEGAVSWSIRNTQPGLNIFQSFTYENLTYSAIFQPAILAKALGRYYCSVRVHLNNNDKAVYYSPEVDTADVTRSLSIIPEVQLDFSINTDSRISIGDQKTTSLRCFIRHFEPAPPVEFTYKILFYVFKTPRAMYSIVPNQGHPIVRWSTLNNIHREQLLRGNDSTFPIFSALFTSDLQSSNQQFSCALELELLPGLERISFYSKMESVQKGN